MSLLTEQEIDAMRAVIVQALPDTATVQTVQGVSDGGGGTTDSWVDGDTFACRIDPIAGGEIGSSTGTNSAPGGRISDETTHIVTLAADTNITEADRLVISTVTYDVTLVRQRGAWELSRRVEVKETA